MENQMEKVMQDSCTDKKANDTALPRFVKLHDLCLGSSSTGRLAARASYQKEDQHNFVQSICFISSRKVL